MNGRKELSFKKYPYFWELSKSGQKPFDLRLYDPDDERFQALEEDWRQCSIRLVNTETGASFRRPVTGYEHVKPFMGNWVIIHFQPGIRGGGVDAQHSDMPEMSGDDVSGARRV